MSPSNYADAGGAQKAGAGLYTQGTILQVGEVSCVVKRFLSSGGHANVYLVTLMQDGALRVLKHIPFGAQADDQLHRRQVEQEIGFMAQLKGHAHIVALEAAEATDDGAFILMEHCGGGDVLSLMNARLATGLDESTIVHIFCDVCKAVAHMHYQGPALLHRDLKVENILAGDGPTYKLCDFGSATASVIAPGTRLAREQIVSVEDEIRRMTTLEYRAPEMVDLYLGRGVTEKADIWALGVLLYKLCYFRTPFDNASALAILNAEYSIPPAPAYSAQLKQIFQMTLREEPRERCNIYTLCAYVCALRGEPCVLENKYASPPGSPTAAHRRQQPQHTGLGCISANPVHQPRRYAASSSRSSSLHRTAAASSSRPGSAGSELDSDSIVPMRRGRPPRPAQQNGYSAGSGLRPPPPPKPTGAANGGRLLLSEAPVPVRSAPTTPQAAEQRAPANYSRSGSSASPQTASAVRSIQIPPRGSSPAPDPAEVLRSAPIPLAAAAAADSNALGIFQQERATSLAADLPPAKLQRMRMSVRAADGRESLSADFVQGAVFGSARRASVLRRKPSVASTASSSPPPPRASRLGNGSAQGDYPASTARNSSADASDDVLSPAPPLAHRSASSSSAVADAAAEPEAPAAACLPGLVRRPLPPPPLSPLASGAKLAADGSDRDGDASPTILITPLSPDNASFPDLSPSIDNVISEEALMASRLSTILESGQDDSRPPSGLPAAQAQREPVRSIYEMTLDKLEDDMRSSVLFDDQPLFDNAKAKYAAQRSSVYQSPDNYFDSSAAQSSWSGIPSDAMDSMRRKMDELGRPPGSSRESPVTAASELGDAALDIDSVLQHAERRNRQKLVAQNNRRSMYIAGGATPDAGIGVLQEDVEDNMRVLSDDEIDALLQRMDMYNRTLLSEQQRWRLQQQQQHGAAGVDMQSLTRIVEQANDQLLRKEQAVPGRMLQSVISAAKLTFGKPRAPPADIGPECPPAPQPFVARNDSDGTAVAAMATPPATAAAERQTVDPAVAEPEPAKREAAPLAVIKHDVAPKPAAPPAVCTTVSADWPRSPEIPDSPVDVGVMLDSDTCSNPVSPLANQPPSTALLAPPRKSAADGPAAEHRSPAVPRSNALAGAAETAAPTARPANPPAAVKAQQPSRIPKLSRMRSDVAIAGGSQSAGDVAADMRARLKKKQSSPALTTGKSLLPGTRTAFLNPPEPKPAARPVAAGTPAKGKPAKSVRNLVAMFDKS
ncbi:Ark- serine/threonine protein kinase [Coemansia sp. Cherry 401B]|nr:Ark- serine/threonine protein kinase [Coemansia sp. RSA 2610]KAJ2727301.1 Ark- serine/threonine protein kinase [Coemansia sp. Cherry 401B]